MAGLVMAAATGGAPTPSMFAPVSSPAFAIREVSFLVLAIVTFIFIFIVVAGLNVYAIIRCRRRPAPDRLGRDDARGPQRDVAVVPHHGRRHRARHAGGLRTSADAAPAAGRSRDPEQTVPQLPPPRW
jgi:hypothetical protein